MPRRRTRLLHRGPIERAADADLRARFASIRSALKVPAEFSPEVLAEAGKAAGRWDGAGYPDLTGIEFVTIDPKGATDLDQAMWLARSGRGYHVDYAIADVPFFVQPGERIDGEARRRGQTIYAPDQRTPLHPPMLSEHAASLLPDAERPAFVWRFDLDAEGSVTHLDLVRARIRSRRQLDYEQVQAAVDDPGEYPDLAGMGALLREIGSRRQALELARGGASLPLPEQEVIVDDTGFSIRLRANLPCENWNAQLSLMTGVAAADLMLKAGIGVLRTMPEPESMALQRFRAQAEVAGVAWPKDVSYGEFLRRLSPQVPEDLSLLYAAAALFRGAGYTPFDGTAPDQPRHAAVAAAYAHVTAPLRRLVDRFGLLCAYAAHQGVPVPDWVAQALPFLPEAMTASDHLAGEVERECLDAVEVETLAPRSGETFDAVVVSVDRNGDGGRVQLVDPPILARCTGDLTAGVRVRVQLDPLTRDAAAVQFHLA
jgi:exoribonuclease R